MALTMYTAPETISSSDRHTLLLKFMYGEHRAEFVTTMLGNTFGADLISSYDEDFLGWMSAPFDIETNQKHCVFDEDATTPSRDVVAIKFYHPNREMIELEMGEAAGYLIGVEIIAYDECVCD